jgi:hypothetical protein
MTAKQAWLLAAMFVVAIGVFLYIVFSLGLWAALPITLGAT